MRISDWSSDVCSSDLRGVRGLLQMREVGELAFDPVAAPGFGVGVAGLAFGGTVGAVLDDVGDGVAELHADHCFVLGTAILRSEEHTSELQSLMRISYAVFCLKKKIKD